MPLTAITRALSLAALVIITTIFLVGVSMKEEIMTLLLVIVCLSIFP